MRLEDLTKMLRPLGNRIANLIGRGTVALVDDSKKMQIVQTSVLADETRDDVERFQNYGFTSVPSKDAEVILLALGGRRDHMVAIVVDDRRYRKTGLADGEVCIYDKSGTLITLKANGDIELKPSSGKIKLTGDLEATGDVKAGAISLTNHVHAVSGTVAAAPGPVTFLPTAGKTGAAS